MATRLLYRKWAAGSLPEAHVCFDGLTLRIDGFYRGAVLIDRLPDGARVRVTKHEGGPFVMDRNFSGAQSPEARKFSVIYDTARVRGIDGLRAVA